jgi:hypothetical protein
MLWVRGKIWICALLFQILLFLCFRMLHKIQEKRVASIAHSCNIFFIDRGQLAQYIEIHTCSTNFDYSDR